LSLWKGFVQDIKELFQAFLWYLAYFQEGRCNNKKLEAFPYKMRL